MLCTITMGRIAGVAIMVSLFMSGCAAVREPVSDTEISIVTDDIIAARRVSTVPVNGGLDVAEAVARSVALNSDIRAKEFEITLAEAKARIQEMDMLPSFVAESTYYGRDRPLLSHGTQSPLYSTASDQRTVARDLTFSWNILDFGVSYLMATEYADSALKQREELRKVTSRIVEETRGAFWRAAALRKLEDGLRLSARESERLLEDSKAALRDTRLDPLQQLEFQRSVLTLRRELEELRTSLAGSDQQLRTLIGAPLDEDVHTYGTPNVIFHESGEFTPEADIRTAFVNRPEVRQVMYDMRISEAEADAALLRLIPALSGNVSRSFDSNSYLYYANWVSWGATIAWNAVNLVRLPAELNAADAEQSVHRQRAITLGAAIALQVRVARAKLVASEAAYREAMRFSSVQREILAQAINSVKAGAASPQLLIKERLETLLAEVRAWVAYAELESARSSHDTAMGLDIQPPNSSAPSTRNSLASLLRQHFGIQEPPSTWPTTVSTQADLKEPRRGTKVGSLGDDALKASFGAATAVVLLAQIYDEHTPP